MTRLEFLQKVNQIIKKIDQFNAELKTKFPNCENNLEQQSFIYHSQTIKADCIRRIEQCLNMSDEEFTKIPTLDFYVKNLETTYKSIELHFKSMMTSCDVYKPSDPSKTFPLI